MSENYVYFEMPDDIDLLAAVGEVAIRHEYLNHMLKMLIKSFADVTLEEVLKATSYESSSQLRDRVRKIARKRIGDGAPLVKLQAILADCKRLTNRRNELIHGLWARELDGEAHIRDAHGGSQPLPTTDELRILSQKIESLTQLIITERHEGFLFNALSESQ